MQKIFLRIVKTLIHSSVVKVLANSLADEKITIMCLSRQFSAVLLLWIAPAFNDLHAQTQSTQPNPQQVLQASLRVLGGAVSITDTKLLAAVNYTAGSDAETGTAVLEASGIDEFSSVLTLTSGTQTQVRQGTTEAVTGVNGQQHIAALHNSLYPAPWFMPALLVQEWLRPTNNVTLVSATNEVRNGQNVIHINAYRLPSGQFDALTGSYLLQASTADLYLDASTLLPLYLDFMAHPDNDELTDFPVTIAFQGYRSVSGVQIPFHIQRFLQRSLLLDLTLSSAAINLGVPQSDFAIQQPAIQ